MAFKGRIDGGLILFLIFGVGNRLRSDRLHGPGVVQADQYCLDSFLLVGIRIRVSTAVKIRDTDEPYFPFKAAAFVTMSAVDIIRSSFRRGADGTPKTIA